MREGKNQIFYFECELFMTNKANIQLKKFVKSFKNHKKIIIIIIMVMENVNKMKKKNDSDVNTAMYIVELIEQNSIVCNSIES